ncbi:MAG: peptide-methionine (S)-S-oxide reductase MsrA [Nanoarchaeota archaeon]|nr:peptide-methionine (S)-S-oxide reductase MsrA [Nanoarchaeota archaeon]
MKEEKAYFAMGCFWSIQAIFDKIRGVLKTTVGYTGGIGEATYEKSEKQDHAEAIEVVFDPKKITFLKLLDTFWSEHDPTTRDSQGSDFGRSYRSAIFYTTLKQKKAALKSMKDFQSVLENKITTEIKSFKKFYAAEEYHQRYFMKHGKTC